MGYFLPVERPDIQNPEEVYLRLLRLDEHAHIVEAEARVEFLMRTHEEVKGGRVVLGTVFRPEVQGRLRDVFEWLLEDKFGGLGEGERGIDFLIVLDAQFWLDADDEAREILVYHEMCHIQPAFDKMGAQRFDRDTGLPVLTLQNHDVEEFSQVVRRYGAYSRDIEEFVRACRDGEAAKGLDRQDVRIPGRS